MQDPDARASQASADGESSWMAQDHDAPKSHASPEYGGSSPMLQDQDAPASHAFPDGASSPILQDHAAPESLASPEYGVSSPMLQDSDRPTPRDSANSSPAGDHTDLFSPQGVSPQNPSPASPSDAMQDVDMLPTNADPDDRQDTESDFQPSPNALQKYTPLVFPSSTPRRSLSKHQSFIPRWKQLSPSPTPDEPLPRTPWMRRTQTQGFGGSFPSNSSTSDLVYASPSRPVGDYVISVRPPRPLLLEHRDTAPSQQSASHRGTVQPREHSGSRSRKTNAVAGPSRPRIEAAPSSRIQAISIDHSNPLASTSQSGEGSSSRSRQTYIVSAPLHSILTHHGSGPSHARDGAAAPRAHPHSDRPDIDRPEAAHRNARVPDARADAQPRLHQRPAQGSSAPAQSARARAMVPPPPPNREKSAARPRNEARGQGTRNAAPPPPPTTQPVSLLNSPNNRQQPSARTGHQQPSTSSNSGQSTDLFGFQQYYTPADLAAYNTRRLAMIKLCDDALKAISEGCPMCWARGFSNWRHSQWQCREQCAKDGDDAWDSFKGAFEMPRDGYCFGCLMPQKSL
ncbi:hypothetical protein B0H19DRAFT_160704 [Mycena capillaripes]|nr:hypothetical protein B0H19DRAFT_160704 [Mycena capillaripes]